MVKSRIKKLLINQQRAHVNDRMDLTLLELKDFYDNMESKNALYSLRLRNAFIKSKDWLKKFLEFKGFVDFFILKGSFVDEDYNIIPLHLWNLKIDSFHLTT